MHSPTPDPEEEPALTADPAESETQPDPMLAALLGGQAGGNLDLLRLLAAQTPGDAAGGSTDEQLGIVLRWLEQQQAAAQSDPDDSGASEEERERQRLEELQRRRDHHERQRQRMRDLKQVLKALYAELETLRARNDAFAAAIGACYLCFGEDAMCPECGGQGVPGSLPPDAAAFREHVAPAIRRLRSAHTYRPNGALAPMRGEGNGYHGHAEDEPPDDSTT